MIQTVKMFYVTKLSKRLPAILVVILVSSFFLSWRVSYKINNLNKKVSLARKESRHFYKELAQPVSQTQASVIFNNFSQENIDEIVQQLFMTAAPCKTLENVPYADDTGLIKSIRPIYLDGVTAPYNASMVEDGDGYLMTFRYDLTQPTAETPFRELVPLSATTALFRTFIGAVRLDKNFQQISPIKTIDTGSDFSEDARIFKAGGQIYIVYNELQDHFIYIRSMKIACLDSQTLDTRFITDIDQQISFIDRNGIHIEKNWTPFIREENGKEEIYFGYSINPHKLLNLTDPQKNELRHPIYSSAVSFQEIPWDEQKWGTLRGGTPAILVEGQYLAFFHTLFFEKGIPWYSMGAYTFEANPPYRVTAVSAAPILFRGAYYTSNESDKRILFPAGIILGREGNQEVIHVSCGAHDKSIKILTFDKRSILDSLSPVKPFESVYQDKALSIEYQSQEAL